MEADKVLHCIIEKLKEDKINPKQSSQQENFKRKKLMNLFYVYSSLRKKELVKQKLQESKEVNSAALEESHRNSNKNIEDNVPNVCNEILDIENYKQYEIIENDSTSISTEFDDNSIIDDELNEQSNVILNGKENIISKDCNIKDSDLEYENSNNKDNKNNQDEKEILQILDNECNISVNRFLSRLGEGLKRLPYMQRSKLEIEFLTRLYEIQDHLGLLND